MLNVWYILTMHVIALVNTHVHADHITGTGWLKALIPSCQSVLAKVAEGQADILFDDGHVIEFGDQSLECRLTPGHTNGKIKHTILCLTEAN